MLKIIQFLKEHYNYYNDKMMKRLISLPDFPTDHLKSEPNPNHRILELHLTSSKIKRRCFHIVCRYF